MLIDWFTVGAQVVNFLILMWLLKHFLYKPVLDAIDAREQRITHRLQQAQEMQAAADRERSKYEHQNAEFEQQHAGLLKQASADAQAARRRMLEEARKEAAALREQWREALRKEQQGLSEGIATHTRQEVFGIVRKVLAELADTGLEASMVEVFIRRLQSMQDEERAAFVTKLDGSEKPVIIRSGFELPVEALTNLTRAVKDNLSIHVPLHYETEPELVCGIELISGGHKLAWNVTDYLGALEENIDGLLARKTADETAHREQDNAG